MKLAVRVYSPLGDGMVPKVPDSDDPGPQNLSSTDEEVWSRKVSVMLDSFVHRDQSSRDLPTTTVSLQLDQTGS